MATITITELAAAFDTDARTARKFMRTVTPRDEQPGKGSRWAIEKRDIRSLRSKYAKFTEAEEARKAAKALEAPTAPEADIAPIEDIEDEALEALEPTDADIEAIMLEADIED